MSVRRAFSGAPWESRAAYCRAIRVGNRVWVSGTAPMDGDKVHAPGDPYAQAVRCWDIVKSAMADVGCPMSAVVRTRMFVTDISHSDAFCRAHHEVFADHPPTTTMVEVRALIAPEMLIEVEAEAVLPPS